MAQLNESFGTGSLLEVDDLRRLYYGRIHLYGTFTNDANPVFTATTKRPKSVLFHTVQDIVGKRASSNEFWLVVSRLIPSKGFIDIGEYTDEMFLKDLAKIQKMQLLDEENFNDLVSKPRFRNVSKPAFERFWNFTASLAKLIGGESKWRDILSALGYWGFEDKRGRGIFHKHGVPAAIVLKEKFINTVDILPIQKFRKDPRKRTTDQIDRINKRLAPSRNIIAKGRRKSQKDSFLDALERAKTWL